MTNVYPTQLPQLQDITDWVTKLNEAEKLLQARGTFGDGLRAVLMGPIPVRTDITDGTEEYLGWLVPNDSGYWSFTQEDPNPSLIADRRS